MDAQTRGFLAALHDGFDAAVARDEEIAADDLARSLVRGVDLRQRLRRGPGAELVLDDGSRIPIATADGDYFICGEPPFLIGHLERNTFALPRQGHTSSCQALDGVGVLAEWAAREERVLVTTPSGGCYQGTLLNARPDHLVLGVQGGELVVPAGLARTIRLVLEG